MARSYEVGDKVKLLVEQEGLEDRYYFGYIIGYDSTTDDDLYRVSIEGIGDTFAKAAERGETL